VGDKNQGDKPVRALLPFALAVGCCMAQTNVRVLGTTATQAAIAYTAPNGSACSIAVSPSSGYAPLINDLITDSTADLARPSTVTAGNARTVVIGARNAPLSGVNGFVTQRISNALQANTSYFYQIACGTSVANGQFSTANIPLGLGYGDPWPSDPTVPGAWATPSSPGAIANEQFTDPQTGILVQRASYPGVGYSTGTQAMTTAYDQGQIPCDTAGPWVTPCNAAGTAGYASVSNSTLPIVVRPDTITSNWGDGLPCETNPTCGGYIQQLQVSITGYCTSSTSSKCQIGVAISMNAGASAASSVKTATLPFTTPATVTVGTHNPGATGIDPWVYDSSPKITLYDSYQYTGSVSTSGSTVTFVSGNNFDGTWTTGGSGRMRLSNVSTSDACTSSSSTSHEETISSGFGNSVTLSAAPGSYTYYCAQDFSVMINRLVADPSTSIYIQNVAVSYVSDDPGEWMDNGNQTVFAHNSVNGGYLGEVLTGGGYGQLSWFYPPTGFVQVIGPMQANAKSTPSGVNTWNSQACPLFSPEIYIAVDDTQTTPTWYCVVTDTTGKLALLQVVYTGACCTTSAESNNFQNGAPIGTGSLLTSDNYSLTYANAVITDLTPSSLGLDLGTLLANYAGGPLDVPAAVPMTACSIGPVQQGNITVYCNLGQNTSSWIFSVSPGNRIPADAGAAGAHVVASLNTWQYAASRFSELHNLQDYGQNNPYLGYGVDGLGPGQSALGTTASIVTSNTAVPATGASCATWGNPLGITGNQCIDITINANSGSYEPYYWTSVGLQGTTPGVPTAAAVGDTVCLSESQTVCSWPSLAQEYAMILQKGVSGNPSQWILRRGPFIEILASITSGTYTSLASGSLAGTGTCTLTGWNVGSRWTGTAATATVPISGGVIAAGAALTFTNNGSGYASSPSQATLGSGSGTGVCTGTANITTVLTADTGLKYLFFLPSNFSNAAGVPGWGGMYAAYPAAIPSPIYGNNVLWDYQTDPLGQNAFFDPEGTGGHGFVRPTQIVTASGFPYAPYTPDYNVRHAANFTALLTTPLGIVTANPSFQGVVGSATANVYQSHAGMSGENATVYEGQAAFDVRPLTGQGTSNPGTGPYQQFTLVTGNIWVNTWTGANYTDVDDFGAVNRKIYATAANVGPHPLIDISGPGSNISTAALYTYCATRAAGECYTGSSVGQIYVNAPGIVYPWCYGNPTNGQSSPQVNDICVTNSTPLGQAGVQLSTLGNDPLATFQRVLTRAMNGAPHETSGFASIHVLPDNSWAMFQGNYNDGISRNDYMAMMPPFPPADSVARGVFVAVPIAVKPPAGAEVNNAIVQFGYQEYGGNCTTRADACIANAAAIPTGHLPFLYASETPAGLACSSGCTVMIPAISQRVLYYKVEYRNASNNVLSATPNQVLLVP
jgi:hypothetical protein